MLVETTLVPPVFVVYQPINILFVNVGVGNSPYISPYVTVFALVPTVPPFASNVTVTLIGSKYGYNVWFCVSVTTVFASILVPCPFSFVYHPLNVCPFFVTVSKLPYVPPTFISFLV